MKKSEIIKKMMESGRAGDVLDFVEGDSVYISDASEGAPQNPELRRIWVLIVHHLRFVSEFGEVKDVQLKNGKYFSPNFDAFDKWLKEGAPGVAYEDLVAYLKDNPF